jgi:hypothetical protein
MRSHRGGWLGSWVLGSILAVAPAVSTTVYAQPGFGPDPFWPYNNQYAPYTSPLGPASPDAGQGSAMVGRPGYTTANQFQQYLDGMSGPGRNQSDRSGVGVPYYRGAVDPDFGDREYQPNKQSNASFEETQRQVTEKYFAYLSERDPKKRSELLREYQHARRDSTRALSPRAQSPSRVLGAASRFRPESGSSRASGRLRDDMSESASLPHEPGTMSRSESSATRSGTANSARGQARAAGPAPPVPTVVPSQGGARSRNTPSSVLNRARSMDDRNVRVPGSSSATLRSRRTDQRTNPLVPTPLEE